MGVALRGTFLPALDSTVFPTACTLMGSRIRRLERRGGLVLGFLCHREDWLFRCRRIAYEDPVGILLLLQIGVFCLSPRKGIAG
jgi:hypothetical protein